MKAGLTLAVLAIVAAALWLWPGWRSDASHILITDAVLTPLDIGGAAALARIENNGAPDRLVAVRSPIGSAQFYDPAQTGRLPIPQGTVSLALDAAHITVQPDGETLRDGDLIPMTLTFEKAGEVSFKARLSDPKATGQAEEVGLFGLGDICIVGQGEPAPKVSLTITPEDDGWRVAITAEEFTFSEDLVGLYHVPGMGHGHLYVGGMKLGRIYQPTAYIGALPKGAHEIRVTLNTNDHRAYMVDDTPVTARAVIEVD